MHPAKDPTPKPDLTPALRQALEAVFTKRAAQAVPALTRAQKRPILQPDLRRAPPRVAPKAPAKAKPTPSVVATLAKPATRAAANSAALKSTSPTSSSTRKKPAVTQTPQSQSPPPIKTLQDLRAVKRTMESRAKLAAERQAARLALEAKTRAEKEFFSRAVGAVKALPAKHRPGHRAVLPTVQAPPIAVQHQRDELAVMREAISDEFDAETLLDTDETLSFRRPGMGPDVTRKLRRGGWSIQGQLDLHGLRREDAREALSHFIRDATRVGWRCVRVVHGKGLGSPGKTPVLKGKVQSWLVQKQEVLAFVQARPAHGGAGALLVLLTQH